MFNITKLFCVIDDFFLKFEAIYWKFLKQSRQSKYALHLALMKGQHSQYLKGDSTTLSVFKNQRIQRHKSLAKIASRGKSSMSWFNGCKLNIAMNQFGEITRSTL